MECNQLVLPAPAKVNYLLKVLRKREDGYHDLKMIMQRIDLCDKIRIAVNETPGIRVTCDNQWVPDGPQNIAWRAAEAICSISNCKAGIDIAIEKHIPVAAGLGGGSSDAATVITGLNELLETSLSTAEMMKIAAGLGADVPFFVYGRTSVAEGIGEKLTPVLKIPRPWIVLVNPNVHVSTAWVYKNLQLTTVKDDHTMPNFFDNIEDLCAIIENDLERVTIKRFPVINEIKNQLKSKGASASLMSGSGPTVFGIFESETAARTTAAEIADEKGWFTAVAIALE